MMATKLLENAVVLYDEIANYDFVSVSSRKKSAWSFSSETYVDTSRTCRSHGGICFSVVRKLLFLAVCHLRTAHIISYVVNLAIGRIAQSIRFLLVDLGCGL